jgi:hypothetical protein
MSLHPNSYQDDSLLARIRNFQSAGTVSSQAHVPVFALTDPVSRTITSSSHIMSTLVPAANTIFMNFEQSVHNFWSQLPAVQRRDLLALQEALRILAQLPNIQVPNDPAHVIELANQLQALLQVSQ